MFILSTPLAVVASATSIARARAHPPRTLTALNLAIPLFTLPGAVEPGTYTLEVAESLMQPKRKNVNI